MSLMVNRLAGEVKHLGRGFRKVMVSGGVTFALPCTGV